QVMPNRRIAPMTMSAMLPPIVKDPSPPIVSAAARRATAGVSAGPADAMTARDDCGWGLSSSHGSAQTRAHASPIEG
ncbi:MAG: hypothetical protein WA895_29720, partial [Streptosporangiaceae bacterium]